eukprot:1575624-Pyramimonas_sp.AAC.2
MVRATGVYWLSPTSLFRHCRWLTKLAKLPSPIGLQAPRGIRVREGSNCDKKPHLVRTKQPENKAQWSIDPPFTSVMLAPGMETTVQRKHRLCLRLIIASVYYATPSVYVRNSGLRPNGVFL